MSMCRYGDTASDVATEKRVFVSTDQGTVFQVNYRKRMLECIFKLHEKAIPSLAVNEAFCVTGRFFTVHAPFQVFFLNVPTLLVSEDKMLRVWPVDFSDFFLEAEHQTSVVSAAISKDGLQVAAVQTSAALAILDVVNHAYPTKVRSHSSPINGLALRPSVSGEEGEFCTVAADGTIRVWSSASWEQTYEFSNIGKAPFSPLSPWFCLHFTMLFRASLHCHCLLH